MTAGAGIYLAVYEILEIERKQLDLCEGVGDGYDYREIELEDFGTCSTYIASPSSIDDSLNPLDWYREYVIRGARYNDFPPEYIAALASIHAVADSDNDRACREWKLVDTLRVENQQRASPDI
ncbi:MAG: gamma-glutamylcyclotransferase [Woeseia sp.]|nr:gamma-glutamylcyclotransferase [Woeseia sp.]